MPGEKTWRKRLAAMRSLLEGDRVLLLAGRILELAEQDDRRVAMERRLMEMPHMVAEREVALIDDIRYLAARNNRLLAAYMDGMRRAAARLTERDTNLRAIGAYQRDGTRIETAKPAATQQRRA